jgi:hypothetical protein
VYVFIIVRIKDELDEPFAVAQIYKDKPAVIAPSLHPPHKGKLRANITLSYEATPFAPSPISKIIQKNLHKKYL